MRRQEERSMEACCLTSNSFTKTIELAAAPSAKAGILSYPKRNRGGYYQFHGKKVAFQSTVTCKCFVLDLGLVLFLLHLFIIMHGVLVSCEQVLLKEVLLLGSIDTLQKISCCHV